MSIHIPIERTCLLLPKLPTNQMMTSRCSASDHIARFVTLVEHVYRRLYVYYFVHICILFRHLGCLTFCTATCISVNCIRDETTGQHTICLAFSDSFHQEGRYLSLEADSFYIGMYAPINWKYYFLFICADVLEKLQSNWVYYLVFFLRD